MKFRFILNLLIAISISTVVKGQVDVVVGLYVNDIIIRKNDGIFYADFYWWSKVPITLEKDSALFLSKLDFINSTNDVEIELSQTLKLDSFYYFQGYCKGHFNYLYDFRKYPFDKQTIPIIIESVNLSEETVVLKTDINSYSEGTIRGLNNEIEFGDFKIISAGFDNKSKIYATSFGDPNYKINSKFSRLSYNIDIKRDHRSYVLKIMIPCIILAIISYLVFFIPAQLLEVAVGCTVTSLLACIALQLTTANDIPNIGYLTVANKIYYFFYGMICLALIQTVWTYNLEMKGKSKLAHNLEIAGRVLFPIILGVGYFIIVY
jgi:hypothetical protein